MDILGILTGLWIIHSGQRLSKTKNINELGWDPERNIKDKDGYIKLFSKMYFINGITLIILSSFLILDELFFNISFRTLVIICIIICVFLFIEGFVINKKKRKFLY